jgi:rubredoxin
MKKQKKPEIKDLKKRCDILFSRFIRARDHYKCVLCGSVYMPQCGHVLSRVALATRWDYDNAFCQCAKCNMKHEYNAYPFIAWYINKFSKEKLDEMQARWNKPHPMKRYDYEPLIKELEVKCKELGVSIE